MRYRDVAFAVGLVLNSAFATGSGCAGLAKTHRVRSVSEAAKLLRTKPGDVFRAGDYFLTNGAYQHIRKIAALYKGASVSMYAGDCTIEGMAGPFDADSLREAVRFVGEKYVPKGSNIITVDQASKAKDYLCRQKAGSDQ